MPPGVTAPDRRGVRRGGRLRGPSYPLPGRPTEPRSSGVLPVTAGEQLTVLVGQARRRVNGRGDVRRRWRDRVRTQYLGSGWWRVVRLRRRRRPAGRGGRWWRRGTPNRVQPPGGSGRRGRGDQYRGQREQAAATPARASAHGRHAWRRAAPAAATPMRSFSATDGSGPAAAAAPRPGWVNGGSGSPAARPTTSAAAAAAGTSAAAAARTGRPAPVARATRTPRSRA